MSSNQKAMVELIKATSGQANVLTIPRPYIEFMGSLDGGLFLSQVIYWSDRGGKDNGWFYKTYEEWQDELTLSKYEVSKQVKILKEKGLLETKVKKANGAPTVHYKFSFVEFQKSLVKFLHYRKSRNLTIESEETLQSITETTTETTTERKPPSKNSQNGSGFDHADIAEKNNLNQLAEGIADICKVAIDLASPKTREALKTVTLALYGKSINLDNLKSFRDWWYNEYWVGQKGQPPTPSQVGDTWGQFEATQASPNSMTSAPTLTAEQKARLDELTAQLK